MQRLQLVFRNRWQRLFTKLATIPRSKYDFMTWGINRIGDDEESAQPDLKVCTTVGCTAGSPPSTHAIGAGMSFAKSLPFGPLSATCTHRVSNRMWPPSSTFRTRSPAPL